MGLIKRPGTLTFLIALLLALASVLSYAGVAVPLIRGYEYLALLAGHVVLTLGCIMRGM